MTTTTARISVWGKRRRNVTVKWSDQIQLLLPRNDAAGLLPVVARWSSFMVWLDSPRTPSTLSGPTYYAQCPQSHSMDVVLVYDKSFSKWIAFYSEWWSSCGRGAKERPSPLGLRVPYKVCINCMLWYSEWWSMLNVGWQTHLRWIWLWARDGLSVYQ